MIQSNPSRVRTAAAVTTLLGSIFLAGPLFAAASSPQLIAQASSEQAMAATAPASPSNASIESRIVDLHRRLKITDAQKPQWDALAQVMRENAQKMVDLEKQRATDANSMTAVDVIKSYSEVIDAHEDGMKKFIPAFEDLYSSMSDPQKKIADSLFRSRARTEAKRAVSKES